MGQGGFQDARALGPLAVDQKIGLHLSPTGISQSISVLSDSIGFISTIYIINSTHGNKHTEVGGVGTLASRCSPVDCFKTGAKVSARSLVPERHASLFNFRKPASRAAAAVAAV